MSNDTSTTLNPGSGGDALDETNVVQSDGVTTVKRPRVDVGFASEETPGRLVSRNDPLPVQMRQLELLEQMAEDIREMKLLLATALTS